MGIIKLIITIFISFSGFNEVKAQFFLVNNAAAGECYLINLGTHDTAFIAKNENWIKFNTDSVVFPKIGTQLKDYMTIASAGGTISAMTSSINSKAPMSRSITIGSQIFDLSADRTFTLPIFTQTIQVIPAPTLAITGNSLYSIGGNTVAFPTQTISTTLTAGSNISISGSHPNFTITNTNSLTSLSGSTGISINGSTITNTSPNITPTITPGAYITSTASGSSFTIASVTPTFTPGNNDITITGAWPSLTLTPYVPTTYTVNRSINSSTFQISATRRANLVYNTLLTSTTNISGASDAIVLLQYSIDSGSTWINATQMENGGTATLALALNFVNKQAGVIVFFGVPAGAILKLVPTATNATNTFITGFEQY
jgi:hypothetical protein